MLPQKQHDSLPRGGGFQPLLLMTGTGLSDWRVAIVHAWNADRRGGSMPPHPVNRCRSCRCRQNKPPRIAGMAVQKEFKLRFPFTAHTITQITIPAPETPPGWKDKQARGISKKKDL